ncbi:MAG: cell wall-binding protein [Clostridiales bacterium]|nr:cell wall-binding protein [Clostridiales bacterium]
MRKQTKRLIIPCAAAALALGASMTSFASVGWSKEDETWYYYNSDGELATNEWKKSGSSYFWLDENGEMATSQLIEDDDNYYYVDENGYRISNQWRELPIEEADEDNYNTAWYYFSSTGKAYKAPDSGRTTFKSIVKADGTTRKYAFDEEGRMLYGWVNENSERETGDDAWQNALYYLGEYGDGEMRDNEWARIEVDDDENEDDDFDGWYWFFFKSNGKKVTDSTKTINGKKYRFEEYGNAVFNWYAKASTATASTASDSNLFYSQPSDSWLSVGWFYTVPGENVDSEAYNDDEAYWFYADKNGELYTSQIKKINGYYYAFNEYGEMLEGLYKMSVNDKEIQSYEEIESEDDLPDEEEDWDVYYFGGNSKTGAMKTGTCTIELDGEKYKYQFEKSGDERGKGTNGIDDGLLYIKGQLQQADSDEKVKVVTFEDNDYLVNTSGKVQKNKKNTKDGDDRYYCTDSDGIVTYYGNTKYSEDED